MFRRQGPRAVLSTGARTASRDRDPYVRVQLKRSANPRRQKKGGGLVLLEGEGAAAGAAMAKVKQVLH